MNWMETFIKDFKEMRPPVPEAIAVWCLEHGTSRDNLGKTMVDMANAMFKADQYVVAYWLLNACKQGYADAHAGETFERLIEIAETKFIEIAHGWLEGPVRCREEDKNLLRKHLTVNVSAMLSRYPGLAMKIQAITGDNEVEIYLRDDHQVGSGMPFSLMNHGYSPPYHYDLSPVNQIEFGRVENGVCFYGMGSGVQVISMFRLTHFDYPSPQIGCFVIDPSLAVFMANMAMHDWRELLASDRVFWHVGQDGYDAFFDYLRKERQFLPSFALNIEPGIVDEATTRVNTIVREKEAEYLELTAHVEEMYRHEPDTCWLPPYTRERPLRVMGLTSLFTVYLQYCMRDWLAGFRMLGCETRFLVEKHPALRLTNNYSLSEIKAFNPDLIVGICYNRSNLSFPVPVTIPFVNWQQDKLKHSRTSETIQGLGGSDLIITAHSYTAEWMKEDGYAEEKICNFNFFPTNSEIYRPVKLSSPDIDKYACEISFVSNCTKTAEAAFRELCETYGHCGQEIQKYFGLFFDMIVEKFNRWKHYPCTSGEYDDMFEVFSRNTPLENLDAGLREEIAYKFHYIGDRLLRHRPLEALAESGVDIVLYGDGWENHPTLGRYAKGIARNGEELNLINNASKIVYHAISDVTLHPRFMDAAASGAFIMVKQLHGDVDRVDRLFTQDEEFIYFEGPGDISEKVHYYLTHDAERRTIAENAAIRAQSYTYKAFADRLLELVSKNPLNINAF